MRSLEILALALTAGLTAASPTAELQKERRQFGGFGGFKGLVGGLGSAPPDGSGGILGSLGNMGNAAGMMVQMVLNAGYGKVAPPLGAAPARVELPPRFPQVKGSKSVKLRYGPYKVPEVTRTSFIGEPGMLWNWPDTAIEKPCKSCMVFGMDSGLEYADGKNANIDTGLWLHHIVIMNKGEGRTDPTCVNSLFSLPHIVVGFTPQNSERFWASGNERTKLHFADWNITDVGYPIREGDQFAMIVDLMNMNPDAKTVYVTQYYDYVEGDHPDWDEAKPVWFDADQCGLSEVVPRSQTGNFQIQAQPWTANFDGEVLGMAGHLHDGGSEIIIEMDGKHVCTSTATYAGSPEFVQPEGLGGSHGHGMDHLSNMSICAVGGTGTLDVGEVKKGQKWVLKGTYDYGKYEGMTHDGKQDTVMGIAIMFVRVKK